MSLDDRAADRQPHAHSSGFGGEEGVEDAVDVRWIESRTDIHDRDQHVARLLELRNNSQYPRPVHDRAHRLDAIHDKIKDNLLQLDTVAREGSDTVRELGLKRNILSSQLTAQQDEDLSDRVVDVELRHLELGLPGQGA